MVDKYKYEPEGVAEVISSLKEKTIQYESTISRLNNLVTTIKDSNAWVDDNMKNDFINTCNSYLTIYNKMIKTMESYTKYLSEKAKKASDLENTYSGVKSYEL